MQRLLLALFAVFLSLALPLQDAEAKRLGGGKSYGMQRQAPMKREATPNQAQNAPAQNPGNAAAAQPGKRSWMGPLAGLAAGLGLAALASHLGFGEGMANFLMIALLAMAAFMLIRWFMRRNQAATRPVEYAGAAAGAAQPVRFEPAQALPGGVTNAKSESPAALPPGFDAEAFLRQAKVNFLRLQAANDAGNLDDIREFTTPEMYAEIKLDIDERKGAKQHTDVVMLNADVLEALEEDQRQIVSVRYHGMLREDSEQAVPFDETWHLTRPSDASRGWVVAGIQQNA
jgi:predicted lipid-binding transport protein (Tim44 family)